MRRFEAEDLVRCRMERVLFVCFFKISFTVVLTWTDAETSNDPHNAAHADVAHEGQMHL